MSNQKIVFQNDAGGVSVIIPAANELKTRTIQQIADKDVPAGKPYAIVDASEIPSDRTFRGAWEVDPADLTHGTGNLSNTYE